METKENSQESKTVTSKQFQFTPAQDLAFKYILEGKNIFITGPSGTGKSLVIKTFRDLYKGVKKIAVTSTTGISALLIGGTTLHSYLGIGLGSGSVEDLYNAIMKNQKAKQRWLQLDVLVIDEVSMLSPELFDKLEELGRMVRGKTRFIEAFTPGMKAPLFGGIQLILSGDFLQLPVVGNDYFCFESKSWSKCVDKVVHLTDIMRQADKEFQDVLNSLRFGRVTAEAKELLDSRINAKLENKFGIKPTRIYTTNTAVDTINQRELYKLAGDDKDLYEYEMSITFLDFVKNRELLLEKYRKSAIAPDILQLCVGAQVMLLCNLDMENGLANGSRGVVIDFIQGQPLVRFLNGYECVIDKHVWEIEEDRKIAVIISQIPLKLAWCITVHKSQGITLDYAQINLNNVFAHGQAYVALSRVKNKEGLSIQSISYDSIKAHPKALEFYENLSE